MQTTLDADDMRLLILAHSEGEMQRDFAAALATMGPSPYYEFYPLRLRISGPDPILEMWSRIFGEDGWLHPFDPANHVPDAPFEFEEMVGENAIVHIMGSAFVAEDGEQRSTSNVVRYRFEGDKMESETLWVCSNLVPYLDTVFDETFRALPGVEDI
jgi:hypothetical protein